MPLEKAFAIHATPAKIWDALTAELAQGDPSAYAVERAVPGHELSLWVHLQRGVRALLTYRIEPHDDHTEVAVTMLPQGFRYAVGKIITLGRIDTNYELLLVQGLANLKASVEENTTPDEDGDMEGELSETEPSR